MLVGSQFVLCTVQRLFEYTVFKKRVTEQMDFIPRAQPHQFRNVPGPSRSRQNTTTPLTDLPSRFSTWSNDSEFNSGETRYRDDNSNDRKAGLGKLEQDALEDERWANRHEEFVRLKI